MAGYQNLERKAMSGMDSQLSSDGLNRMAEGMGGAAIDLLLHSRMRYDLNRMQARAQMI